MANVGMTIDAKVQVDRSTAEFALKIAEMFVNNNGLSVGGQQLADGTLALFFVDPAQVAQQEREEAADDAGSSVAGIPE